MSYYQYCYLCLKKIVKGSFILIIFLSTIFITILIFLNSIKPSIIFLTSEQLQANSKKRLIDSVNYLTQQDKKNETNFAIIFQNTTCNTLGELCDNPNDKSKSLVTNAINLLFLPLANPPASGIYYVKDTLNKSGLIPQAYAAEGIGFASLKPFQGIWLSFRNVVFMLMILIMIVIGFMIMLKVKIGSQNSITIESALPKITISLILITFSYAIAGFMIDLMYISVGFIALIFTSATNPTTGNQFVNMNIQDVLRMFFGNYFIFNSLDIGLNSSTIWKVSGGLMGILPKEVNFLVSAIFSGVLSGLATNWLAAKFPQLKVFLETKNAAEHVKSSGTIGVSIIAGVVIIILELIAHYFWDVFGLKILIWILLWLSLIYIFFKIFFLLLQSYINILLLVIFSPLIISMEAIPGKSTFLPWLKSLTYYLLTFPIFACLILLARAIIGIPTDNVSALFTPPFFTAIDAESFKNIIAGAIIFMIPELINQIKQVIGIKPMDSSFGSMALPAFFAGGMAAASSAFGVVKGWGSLKLGLGIGSKDKEPPQQGH